MKFITVAATSVAPATTTLFIMLFAVSLLTAWRPAGADAALIKPHTFGPGGSPLWKLDQVAKVHKPGWNVQKEVETIKGCPLSAAFAKYSQNALFVIDNKGLISNVEGRAYVKAPFNWYRLIDFQLDFTTAFAQVRYERPSTFKTKHQVIEEVRQHYRAAVLSLGEYLYLSPDFQLPQELSGSADLSSKSISSSSPFCLVWRLFHGKNATYALESEVPIPTADCPPLSSTFRLAVIADSGLFIMAVGTVCVLAVIISVAFTIRVSLQ